VTAGDEEMAPEWVNCGWQCLITTPDGPAHVTWASHATGNVGQSLLLAGFRAKDPQLAAAFVRRSNVGVRDSAQYGR